MKSMILKVTLNPDQAFKGIPETPSSADSEHNDLLIVQCT